MASWSSFSSLLTSLISLLVVEADAKVVGTSDMRGSLGDAMMSVVEFMRVSLRIRVGTAELSVGSEVCLLARIGPSCSDDMS